MEESNKNIEFQQQWRAGQELGSQGSSFGKKLAVALVNYSGGRIKDEKQANLVLAGLAVIFLLIAAFTFYSASTPPKRPPRGFEGNYFETYD